MALGTLEAAAHVSPRMRTPENLVWTISQDPDVAAWAATLPERIEDVARRWSLRVGRPYEPGGYCSYVVRVTQHDGTPAVLKLAFGGDGPDHAVAGFREGSTHSMVRIERARRLASLVG